MALEHSHQGPFCSRRITVGVKVRVSAGIPVRVALCGSVMFSVRVRVRVAAMVSMRVPLLGLPGHRGAGDS